MNRLTEKINNYYFSKNKIESDHNKELLKLGQLEDIEDELGIDLVTLFKALEDGIYLFGEVGTIAFADNCSLNSEGLYIPDFGYLSVSDYGKTWSLNKEDLENE